MANKINHNNFAKQQLGKLIVAHSYREGKFHSVVRS